MWSLGLSVLLVTILLLAPTSSVTVSADGSGVGPGPDLGPIPVLTLSLEPNHMEAEVTQSQLGAVTFGGTATVDQMRIMSSTGTLQAVVNTGWPVVVSPQTLEFQGPGSEEFQVSVIVPPATSALLTGNVIVNGQCKAPGLAPVVASCSGVVTVSPYYLGRIIASSSDLELTAGEKRKIELSLYNDGNTPTSMRVYVADRPDYLRVSFSETEFYVQQQRFVNVSVNVSATSDASAGDYEMVLVMEADMRDGGTQQVAAFNITVLVPSIKARLGTSGIVSIIVVSAVAVTLVVLWRMGKLKGLKEVRLPRRTKSSSDTGE
jgi:hypothetical protein